MLVVIELRKPGVPVRAAFDANLTSYKHPHNGIPALFVFNALLLASNDTDSRVGSLTADWKRFFEGEAAKFILGVSPRPARYLSQLRLCV